MDEQRSVRKVCELTQQSITEFLRYFKKAIEASIFRQQFQAAAEMERGMLKVQENPHKYTIITVRNGSEQDFAELLEKLDIPNTYINSDFLSDFNGSWIISVEDMETLHEYAKSLDQEIILDIIDDSEERDDGSGHDREEDPEDSYDDQPVEEDSEPETEPDPEDSYDDQPVEEDSEPETEPDPEVSDDANNQIPDETEEKEEDKRPTGNHEGKNNKPQNEDIAHGDRNPEISSEDVVSQEYPSDNNGAVYESGTSQPEYSSETYYNKEHTNISSYDEAAAVISSEVDVQANTTQEYPQSENSESGYHSNDQQNLSSYEAQYEYSDTQKETSYESQQYQDSSYPVEDSYIQKEKIKEKRTQSQTGQDGYIDQDKYEKVDAQSGYAENYAHSYGESSEGLQYKATQEEQSSVNTEEVRPGITGCEKNDTLREEYRDVSVKEYSGDYEQKDLHAMAQPDRPEVAHSRQEESMSFSMDTGKGVSHAKRESSYMMEDQKNDTHRVDDLQDPLPGGKNPGLTNREPVQETSFAEPREGLVKESAGSNGFTGPDSVTGSEQIIKHQQDSSPIKPKDFQDNSPVNINTKSEKELSGGRLGRDDSDGFDSLFGGTGSGRREKPLFSDDHTGAGGTGPNEKGFLPNGELHKVTIESDKIVRTVHAGRHDTITRTIVHAAFDPAIEESELNRGTKPIRNRAFLDCMNAATVFAAKEAMMKDIGMIKKELTSDQQALLAKMIERGNYGKFNLDNPEDLKESLFALHAFMKDNGILESRSISGKSQLFGTRANKKVYEGNAVDRMIDRSKKKEIDLDNRKGPDGKGKPNPRKGPKAKVKETKWTNKERTVWRIRTTAKRNGAKGTKDADEIVEFLYRHNRRFAGTNQAMKSAGKGLENILTLNPLKNTLISSRLQEDPYARNIYKVKNVISGTKSIYHGIGEVAELIGTRREAVLSRRLNQMDKQLGKEGLDPITKSRLDRSRKELDAKKQKIHKKNETRHKKNERRAEKLKRKQLRKTEKHKNRIRRLKKVTRKLKKIVPKPLQPALRVLTKITYKVTRSFFRVLDITSMVSRTLMRLLIQHLLIPIAPYIAGYFGLAAAIIIPGALLVTGSMVINSFFSTEIASIDDATATNSSMRIVYNELQLEESQWSRNLRSLADGNVVHVNELLYADIDESTGNVNSGRGELSASEYLPLMLGLQYDEASDTIITPSPWVGAPPEACHTVDGTITGGVELRYIGTGGYPSYTSNIMELIAMTSTAQQNSTLTEMSGEDLADAAGEMFAGNAEGFFGSVWKSFVTSTVKVGIIVDRIASLIPGYSEFMTSQYAGAIAKTIMAYAKPLFDVSHQMAFGLQFSFLPTDRTLNMDGAESLNQFIQNSWYGEGGGNYQSHDEVRDTEVGREVWQYLISHGFDEIHAAGVMGNFYQESRMNPNAVQYPGMRKGGIGLGQWTGLTANNNRRLKLEQYAARITGSSEGWRNNVKLQMDFLMVADEPATVQRYLNRSFSDPGAAAYWWGVNWERFEISDGSMETDRIPAANSYYELYAEDNSFDFSEGGTESGSGDTGQEEGGTSSNIQYVHSDNLDSEGNPKNTYSTSLKQTKTVKIPGATSLNIEIWYSTEEGHDWIRIRNKEQTSANWESNGQIGIKLTGGESLERPEDGSDQHQIFTINGDTAYFDFYTDQSAGYYGYYAKVTGKVVDQSWLDDQIEASNGYSNIVHDVYVCEGNNGHGCQIFNDFKYNDTTRDYVYYNDERIDNVYPAALDSGLSGETACNVPSGSLSDFYQALDANPDCWEIVLEDEDHNLSGKGRTDGGSSSVIEGLHSDSEGFRATSISSSQFYVTVIANVEEEPDEINNSTDWYHDEYRYLFTHKCAGGHGGYYCGGHVRLLTYGIVYHMTSDQRAGNHEAYTDYSSQEYYKNYSAGFFTSPDELVDKERMRNATDLFGLDTAIRHVKNSVSSDFEGWTYDNIDTAILPLLADWNELYGIATSWTVNGVNGGAGGVDATIMPTAETDKIIATITSQLPHDETDKVRAAALRESLYYVGKISYSQQSHGAVLKEGGKNDCSGFVSRIYYDVIGKILNTDGFVDWAKRYGAYRQFSDGNCKPGDIILSGMGNSSKSDNHALIYVGVVDGTNKTVDCSTRGGSGNVYYSDRGSTYYSKCTYIDMTTAIKGYLSLYPDEAGNLFPQASENETEPAA